MTQLLSSVAVDVAPGVRVEASVRGPRPSRPGPYRVDRDRLPLVMVLSNGAAPSDLVEPWSAVRQVIELAIRHIPISPATPAAMPAAPATAPATPDQLAHWAFEALSCMGVTRADLMGVSADAEAAVACMLRDAPGRVGKVHHATDNPCASAPLPAPTGISHVDGLVVVPVGPENEPQVQALYNHMLDAEEAAQSARVAAAPRDASRPVASGDTSGWKHGCWPLSHDVSDRLSRGLGRACYREIDVERDTEKNLEQVPANNAANPASLVPSSVPLRPRPDARPLGVMFVDHDMGYGFDDATPSWTELPQADALVPHLLATDPAARGTGAARELLHSLVCEAKAAGARVIRLNTSPENVAANELYRRCGFDLLEPTWLPYEGLPLTGWTNPFELWLDPSDPARLADSGRAAACPSDPARPNDPSDPKGDADA